MIEMKIYMPIKANNLPNYFQSASIKPTRYISNRVHDIQNYYDEYLFLTNKMIKSDSDCLLEIVLEKQEADELIFINDTKEFFLLNRPLPITRIKKIHFNDGEAADQITTLIELNTAFLPPQISIVSEMEEYNESDKPSYFNEKSKDWSDEIKMYDCLLGGFALMRLSGEDYMNFSKNYFSTLSSLNAIIENELVVNEQPTSINYLEMLEKDPTLKNIIPYLTKNIDSDDVELMSRKEKQILKKDKITGIIEKDSLEDATYILAILQSYGVGEEARKKKIDGLIVNKFKNEIKKEKRELIAFLYGYNRGYSVFAKKYKLGNRENHVKYELDSMLDYYTIESVYRKSFNNVKQSNEFLFLDKWCPKQSNDLEALRKNQFIIIDKIINSEKIAFGSPAWFANAMRYLFKYEKKTLFIKPLIKKLLELISEDINDNHELIKEQLNVVSRNIADTENHIRSNSNKADIKINEINSRIDEVSKDADTLNRKIYDQNITCGKLEKKTEMIKDENDTLNSKIEGLAKEIRDISKKLTEIKSDNEKLNEKTKTLEEENSKLKIDLEDLSKKKNDNYKSERVVSQKPIKTPRAKKNTKTVQSAKKESILPGDSSLFKDDKTMGE